MDIDSWIKITKVFANIAAPAGIVFGAGWTYFHFRKRREYKPRLEPGITGNIIKNNDLFYLRVIAQLTNAGKSKTNILKTKTFIEISAYDAVAGLSIPLKLIPEYMKTYPVFEKHDWIESGETIQDKLIVAVPMGNQIFFNLDLRVVSNGIEWNVIDIVSCLDEK